MGCGGVGGMCGSRRVHLLLLCVPRRASCPSTRPHPMVVKGGKMRVPKTVLVSVLVAFAVMIALSVCGAFFRPATLIKQRTSSNCAPKDGRLWTEDDACYQCAIRISEGCWFSRGPRDSQDACRIASQMRSWRCKLICNCSPE